ncbi:hypothetical protein N6L24_14360 [Cognatishimia sp. SS12]|uniref:rod-binding protein n=1 Tax=Cognatishimia sp. SS12 TaxID=2979465 RepID=UPI00232FCD40|nr:rod-binding protein [Cognatishimia sp. SS12]MDC0739468.1 hypothetical protein [Cognatishimia sp. SS12]
MADVAMTASLQQALTEMQAKKPQLSEKELQSAKEFEAVFLSQFVDEMMKTVDMGAATGGKDAHMWRSFMSEALSESLVEQGGLGLAANIQQMMTAYKK